MAHQISGKNGETIEIYAIEPGMSKPLGPIGVLAFQEDPNRCELIDPGNAAEFGGIFLVENAINLIKRQVQDFQHYRKFTGFHIIDIKATPQVQETIYIKDF